MHVGSYSGALGMLERKSADIYFKNLHPYSLFENLTVTPAISSEE